MFGLMDRLRELFRAGVSFCQNELKMRPNIAHLDLAMYPSTLVDKDERQFHWELILSPKGERRTKVRGNRYRVKPHPTLGHVFEKIAAPDIKKIDALLARVVIAQIEDVDLVDRIICSTPLVQSDPTWRCHYWICDVLERLGADGNAVGLAQLDWSIIRQFAREYVEGKIVEGRFTRYEDLQKPRPTYDMLTDQEYWP